MFKFKFIPGLAVCALGFENITHRIIHSCIMLGLSFLLPMCIGIFSYYKIYFKSHQHQQNVAPSLQNTATDGALSCSVKEVNISRVLFYVAAGFLFCWIPLWVLIIWRRFFPETCPRIAELLVTFLLFMSASVNPFIYTFTNGDFRTEFRKFLRCGKGARNAQVGAAAAVDNQVEEREDEEIV